MEKTGGHFLAAIRRRDDVERPDAFPWTLPLATTLEELHFPAAVTFLVGENGCGKSTLLEGLAAGMQAVAAGSADIARDPSLAAARSFARGFRFIRRRHARTRLFLRAEDVMGYGRRLSGEAAELDAIAGELMATLPEGIGRTRAVGLARAQRAALTTRYGENPDGRSHGETFLALLQTRLVPNGLYFLDEPETPLSPARVLALMALLKDRVAAGCQFVIATHSPILMALPGAAILLIEADRIEPVAYDEVEHVRLTRAFLAEPERFLRRL
ncbi:putative ATPase [Stella humosa]|uniref:Putative ATPase n=1 Tax=Stella humosa TaxID=94 RepID=A0A3N1LDG8_9PROT|nr:AAA family ATPase [Stella humosa]ROP91131.1 putative ATPase [Stella humosa]